MRDRWVVVACALVGVGGLAGCAAAPPREKPLNADAKELDPVVTLDVARVSANAKRCGLEVAEKLVVSSDDITEPGVARRVIFVVENAGGQDRVEIATKPNSDNPANWRAITLSADHGMQATPRVGKGQVKDNPVWRYEIAFHLDNGQTCTIDPGICIRTQTGGCSY